MSEQISVSVSQRLVAAEALIGYGQQTGRQSDVDNARDYIKKVKAKKGVSSHPIHEDVCEWAVRFIK